MNLLLPLLLLATLLLDMQNALARWFRVVELDEEESDDYTILIPLYNSPEYFKNADRLEPYREHVLLVVDTAVEAMVRFANEAEAGGWRVHRCVAAPSPPALVQAGLAAVETTWTIRMDGDSWFELSPGRAIAAAERARADVCSVKVLPTRRQTLAERMQGVEYDTAMLGRHLRPWLTSGACIIGRTDALRHVLGRHSLWFLGEDIETGLTARHFRMRIRHLECRVYTRVPATFRELFHQRRGWWAGGFRQTWINLDHGLRDPIALVYAAGLVWLLLFSKAMTLTRAMALVPVLIVVYTGITVIANWRVRSRWMILFPYYALAQALVMPPIGAFQYLRVARRSRQLGRYRMGLRRGRWTPPPRARRRRRSLRPCRWNLDSLEQFVRTLSPSSERLHELQLTLVHLRAYADLEGWLPTSFHELVLEVFPEAAERRSRRGDPSQLAAA